MVPYKKTLCLGGSFNPIHHGHLICARAVAEKRGYEQILLIPSGQPPHKPGQFDLASGAQRLQMCKLAIEPGNSNSHHSPAGQHASFAVSDMELPRTGPSYTLDTVRQLRDQGWPEVHWLIGADMLNYLPKWHEPAALLREATFIVMARPGVTIDFTTLPSYMASLEPNVTEAPLVQISSTDIRARVGAGLSIDYLTPDLVVDYIRAQGLYR
jgi:nicotinate-nucleotide adenylyltransferase